jgi:hypothetical protein
LRLECKFSIRDGRWNGSSKHQGISVQASSFERAKAAMEFALGKHIELLLERIKVMTKEQAA